jgi:phage baseplate assembly protein W
MAITIQKTVREFIDFNFNFTRHPISNQLTVKKNTEAVRQSIKNILLTRKGERRFDPNFGSPIYEYLFENYTPILAIVLQDEITRAINFYEPRASVLKVVTNFENHELRADVFFSIQNVSEPVTVSVVINRLR